MVENKFISGKTGLLEFFSFGMVQAKKSVWRILHSMNNKFYFEKKNDSMRLYQYMNDADKRFSLLRLIILDNIPQVSLKLDTHLAVQNRSMYQVVDVTVIYRYGGIGPSGITLDGSPT